MVTISSTEHEKGQCLEDYHQRFGGARGVVVIVIGNGHGDTSSNPGRD